MVALKYLLTALFSAHICVDGYLLSESSDYRDYDANCVASYLKKHHGFNISLKAKSSRLYCNKYIKELEDLFYEKLYDETTPKYSNSSKCKCTEQEENAKQRSICINNLMRRHSVSSVFFKAIGYNYFKRKLLKFSSKTTCDGILNVSSVDKIASYQVMSVEFIGSAKSLWKLRPCLDDLFREYNLNQIYFGDQKSSIGFRRFVGHLRGFFEQLSEVGKSFCTKSNVDYTIKYFGINSLTKEQLSMIYNQTQIECFKYFFVSNQFMGNATYRFTEFIELHRDQEYNRSCDKMMHELVESVVAVDLFGFTEPSQRVKSCVIQRNAKEKLIEKVIVLPALAEKFINTSAEYFEVPQKIHEENTRKIIQISLKCLRYF